MNALESQLDGQPVISLQTGQQIARISEPLVTISNLELIAYLCETFRHQPKLLLMVSDIRQYASDCIIINDEETLTDPADIVRLKSDLKDRYTPLEKAVVADTGRRLGSVEDYDINLDTNRIQKLHVRRPFFFSWFNPPLIIDRTQILDVTPSRILVRDATIAETVIAPDSMPEAQP